LVQDMSGIKNFLQTVFSSKGIFGNKSSEGQSLRLLAKVLKVEKQNIVLMSNQGRLQGRIETPVFHGEHLLLEFSGVKKGRLHYRILARSAFAQDTEGGRPGEIKQPLLWSFLVNPGDGYPDYPVLVRYNPQQDNEDYYRSSSSGEKRKSMLEFIVDTKNLGLIMIKLQLFEDKVHCSFLVEEEASGKALEEEALNSLGDEGAEKRKSAAGIIDWKVHPVRQELLRSAPEGSFSLNKKA